jgi:hypothetical protein
MAAGGSPPQRTVFYDEFGMMNDESEAWGGKQCDNLPIVE